MLIHVVSKIIVRSVKYHIYVERLYIKKGRRLRGRPLCVAQLKNTRWQVKPRVNQQWNVWYEASGVSRLDQKQGRDYRTGGGLKLKMVTEIRQSIMTYCL